MDNHLGDLRSSPETGNPVPKSGVKEAPYPVPSPKKEQRPRGLKYMPSVKVQGKRENRDWIPGMLAFLVVSMIVFGIVWLGLWHIPGIAPWSFPAIDRRVSGLLSINISVFWFLHNVFHVSTFKGYEWETLYRAVRDHGLLTHLTLIMEVSMGCGVVFGAVAFHFVSQGRLKAVHVSGRRLFNRPIDAIRELQREVSKSGEGIHIHPDVAISRDRETRHFFILGAIGSGKTQVLLNILNSILQRMKTGPEDRLILYDNKSDMTSGLPVSDSEMILFAPWDERTWAWDVGKDIVNASDAASFAERLIPESKDKFWSEAPRQIVKSCVQQLQTSHGTDWSWKELSKALSSQETILGAVMLYAPNLAPVFVGSGGGPTSTGASLLSSMNAFTGTIDDLCRAWDNTDPFTGQEIEPGRNIPRVSLREWALTPIVQRRVIVLQGNKRYLTLERAYIQAIVSAFGAIMNSPEMPDSRSRRIWVLLDEFPQLGRLENFAQYLEVGRSKGLCVILGLQDLAQLREIYGRETADVWASICGTYVVCRSQGVETVQWLSRFFGERTINTKRVSKTGSTKGMAKTVTEELRTESVITSDVLNGLGDNKGRSPGILALLGLNTEHGVYRLIWPYVTFPKRRENQIPALWTVVCTNRLSYSFLPELPVVREVSERTKRRGKGGS